eukprot:10658905-Lingulodinium_polyedra.AAC.1
MGKLAILGPARGNVGPVHKAVFGRFARGIRQMLRFSPTCYDLREMLVRATRHCFSLSSSI